ncbi:hypothetical protein [Actinophytocola gossypii]|uniref:Uncharacterized protein n=1 Tax=Actinophytocola gossypii TaxID=2812003 RepID=A0ABT2JDG1_9PSEU|nr:hypothetical protein [Actinophytocola gossypii]MCT2585574.1 hypothetical protein [Actinophytocola gossypii]
MSKTASATFRGMDFWIHDVAKSLLLAEMIAVTDETPVADHGEWLALDEWSAGHEAEFLALVERSTDRLDERGRITAAEAAEWIVLDGEPVIWRGDEVLSTAPVVTLGREILATGRGEYPAPPPGHQWYFGWPGAVRTIRVRTP